MGRPRYARHPKPLCPPAPPPSCPAPTPASHTHAQLNVLPSARFTFHLPSRSAGAWRWAFHSCNGLDSLDNVPKSNGLQPLWQDVVREAGRAGGGMGMDSHHKR